MSEGRKGTRNNEEGVGRGNVNKISETGECCLIE